MLFVPIEFGPHFFRLLFGLDLVVLFEERKSPQLGSKESELNEIYPTISDKVVIKNEYQ